MPKIFLTLAPWEVEGWRMRTGRRILVLQKSEFPKLELHGVRGAVWGHGIDQVWGPAQDQTDSFGLIIPESLPAALASSQTLIHSTFQNQS